jgi:hypothetical protein
MSRRFPHSHVSSDLSSEQDFRRCGPFQLEKLPREIIKAIFEFLLIEDGPIAPCVLGTHGDRCLAILRISPLTLEIGGPIFYGSNTFEFWGAGMLKSTRIQSWIRHITVVIPYPQMYECLRLLEGCPKLKSLYIILFSGSGWQPRHSVHYFKRPPELQSLTIVPHDISLKKRCAELNLQLETISPRRSSRKKGNPAEKVEESQPSG